MKQEDKWLENAQVWIDSGEFDKIVKGAYMSYWEERRKELLKLEQTVITVDAEKEEYRWANRNEKIDKIISQEKEMIRKAFQEYHNKTSCKDKCELCEQDKNEINDFLKSMKIEKI